MDRPDQPLLARSEPASSEDIPPLIDIASCETSSAADGPSHPVANASGDIVAGSDNGNSPEAPANLSAPSSASESKGTKRVSFVLPVKPTDELGEPECWPFGRKSGDAGYRPLTEEELRRLLPSSFRNGKAWVGIPEKRVEHFLTNDLSVDGLMKVFDCFPMLGQKNTPPRALSYQQALGLEITVIEKMDMHLLYSKDKILIKPLPKYLFEPKFWYQYLECPEDCQYHDMFTAFRRGGQLHNSHRLTRLKPCNHSVIWMRALGFAFSYVALVCTKRDFEIAKAKDLIPDDVSFEGWKYFVSRMLGDSAGGKILRQIDKRFTYGELDLARLNQVFMIRSPLKWLLQGNEYRELVQSHFFLPPLSIYVAVVLGYRFARIAYIKMTENQALVIIVFLACLWLVLCLLSFSRAEPPML
ncbi:uncharacterized protein TrAtP1_001951 [Trichoderma atroviride]|uniref:uncharacterized protein n=1 Tax=Hypocrea atroviridis TaxID=63577 RepID=UPI0033231C35|nr:hypothetical protein TrAtP1_001951 [Trichoderma atroviride]